VDPILPQLLYCGVAQALNGNYGRRQIIYIGALRSHRPAKMYAIVNVTGDVAPYKNTFNIYDTEICKNSNNNMRHMRCKKAVGKYVKIK
jgi:hypothetical protein